jgi:DNA-binding response OmpR family regulator
MSAKFGLVIEDDIDLSTIFAEALKNAGYDTEIVHEGTAALERLIATTPDVVVLDLHLPGVDGTDILRQIRADKRLAQTRVLVATADARLAEMLQDQADLVLVKPISFSQLRDLASRLGLPSS